ncbi:MAG TPA: methyltransferase [Kofleriaceae bacterium]
MIGLAEVGAGLRQAGLTARGLAAWAGTARLAALPARLDALLSRPITPAGAALAWLVGGAELARGQLRLAEDVIDGLIAEGLAARAGDRLRARVAIVPLGPSLLVCDRLDAPVERDAVCWPDDSSHHLATAIPPGRRARWLDLGCGSAFAALARPALAAAITGVELNPRAARYAAIGAGLSGVALQVAEGDLAVSAGSAELVTCNPPIPEPVSEPAWAGHLAAELWRRADPGLFDRLWPALRRAVAPGGEVVVHAASDALEPALAAADGERVIVRYTPDGVRGFAVAWWRPDAAPRLVVSQRALTADRPHLEPADRDAALLGA